MRVHMPGHCGACICNGRTDGRTNGDPTYRQTKMCSYVTRAHERPIWKFSIMTTCDEHDCTRTAPGGYCLPPRCYCGACPWHRPIERMPTYTPDRYTAFDRAAILSSTGRRTNLAGYRAAQASRP